MYKTLSGKRAGGSAAAAFRSRASTPTCFTSMRTENGASANCPACSFFSGCKTVADRSVQLPTGSPMSTSAPAWRTRRSMAAIMSGKRQQKQPPATSSTAEPVSLRIAVSTISAAWSLAISPTRRSWAVSRRAASASSVVLPAPRNPPTRIN